MQYLVVEDPDNRYGGGIQPIAFYDNEESAKKAAEMYSVGIKQTINSKYTGFKYRVISVPVISAGSYLVVKIIDDTRGCHIKPIEVHSTEESAEKAAEVYSVEEKQKCDFLAKQYEVICVKRFKEFIPFNV